MDILKKSILVAVFLGSFCAFSQNNSLVEAFTKSYAYEEAGEYNDAINEIKKVYKESDYHANLRLGWLYYVAGLFTESLAYYNKSIDLMPMSIEAKLGAAYPLSALGKWDELIKQYNSILEIAPNNSLAIYRLGSIYYGREDFQTAFKYFEKGLNMYPFDYDFNLMMAWTNLKLGKLREAKVLFNKTLMIQPDDESAIEGLELIE
jgi:tetratricopeptide (TPR) repeat protein